MVGCAACDRIQSPEVVAMGLETYIPISEPLPHRLLPVLSSSEGTPRTDEEQPHRPSSPKRLSDHEEVLVLATGEKIEATVSRRTDADHHPNLSPTGPKYTLKRLGGRAPKGE